MEYLAFKAELKLTHMTIREFARLLDMNPASITNYRQRGSVPRHLAIIATLLRTLHDSGQDYSVVTQLVAKIYPTAANEL